MVAANQWYVRSHGLHSIDSGQSRKPCEPILHWAIKNGIDIGKIGEIVDNFKTIGPDLLNGAWHPAWPSPITAAILADRLDVVKLLLNKGCSIQGNQRLAIPEYRARHNFTVSEDPLLVACTFGKERIANFLIINGASRQEVHLSHAAESGMAQTFAKLVALTDLRDLQQRVLLSGWNLAPFYMATHSKRLENKEIIDLCIANVPVLLSPRAMEYAIYDAYFDGYIENALHMFGRLMETPAYSPLQTCLLASKCARTDSALVLTRLLHQRYGFRVDSTPRRWNLTQNMLFWAIQDYSWGSRRNSETIEYLLSTGCTFTQQHFQTVMSSSHPRVFPSALIARVDEYLRSTNQAVYHWPSVAISLRLIATEDYYNEGHLEEDDSGMICD